MPDPAPETKQGANEPVAPEKKPFPTMPVVMAVLGVLLFVLLIVLG